MTKYKFTSEFTDSNGDKTISSKEFDSEVLYDVMTEFREFLMGCGFDPALVDEYVEVL